MIVSIKEAGVFKCFFLEKGEIIAIEKDILELSFVKGCSVWEKQLSSTWMVEQKPEIGWEGLKYNCWLLLIYFLPLDIF